MIQTEHLDYNIRFTLPEDGPFLLKWLEEPQNLRGFPIQDSTEIQGMKKNWMDFSAYKTSLTATWKNIPCGMGSLFLMPYKKVSHHCMFYVIVDRPFQRKGVGSSLVKNLLNLAKNYFHLDLISAEIFEDSPMLKILECYEFKTFAHQKNYVKEDGIYRSRTLLEYFLDKELPWN